MSEPASETQDGSSGLFPRTHWSVILTAGDLASPDNQRALDEFCRAYRQPVYAYLRGKGHQPSDADDLAQEFFAWFMQKEILAGLTRKGSKFRTYLLKVLGRFLINHWRDRQAQKRGGGAKHVSMDADTESRCVAGLSVESSPETLFDREWAQTVSSRVFSRLREEYEVAGQTQLFECLQRRLSGIGEKLSHAEAGKVLGITEDAARQAAYRMRRRFQELLRMEIAAAGTSKEEIEEEIRYLMAVLAGE